MNKNMNIILRNRKYLYIRWIYLSYYYIKNRKNNIWGGGRLSDEIKNNILLFDKKGKNFFQRLNLILDIINCYISFGATPQEYFLMGFDNSPHKRGLFLTNQHKDRAMISKVGFGENWNLLEDKWIFYKNFSRFFKRDVCLVEFGKNNTEYATEFESFYNRHKRIILKPLNGQCGKGILVINTNEITTKELITRLNEKHSRYIVEEFISQSEFMSKWNNSSVNTIRIPSFYKNNTITILKPFIRTGRRGSIVDNGNSGGIFAVINAETGVIETEGMDIRGKRYTKHPDSGIVFKNTKIPMWNELKTFVKEIHETIPFYPYVGWDFALTSKGWMLIEGNWGQFLSEFVDREGIKNKFDELLS